MDALVPRHVAGRVLHVYTAFGSGTPSPETAAMRYSSFLGPNRLTPSAGTFRTFLIDLRQGFV